MMLLVGVLGVLLLGAGLGWVFLHDNGYVLIVWQQTSVEMSLLLAVLLAICLFVIGLVVLELVLGLAGFKALLGRWWGQQQQGKAQVLLAKGMALMQCDDFGRAEKLLVQAAQLAAEPVPLWMLAAQAAQAQHATQRAEDYLLQAEAHGQRLSVLVAKARLWLASGQWEAAAGLLKSLLVKHRKEPVVAELLLQTLTRLQAWSELEEWLPKLAPALGREKASQRLISAQQKVMQWLAMTGDRMERFAALKRLRDYWHSLPSTSQQHGDVVLSYAEALLTLNFADEAEAEVRRAVQQKWHVGLVGLYGRIASSQPDVARQQAEQWLRGHPHNPVLLLTLGRLCLQNRDWPAAKQYFEQSLALNKNSETYAEYVRLLQHLNDPEVGHYLIAGIQQLVTKPLPHLPLP